MLSTGETEDAHGCAKCGEKRKAPKRSRKVRSERMGRKKRDRSVKSACLIFSVRLASDDERYVDGFFGTGWGLYFGRVSSAQWAVTSSLIRTRRETSRSPEPVVCPLLISFLKNSKWITAIRCGGGRGSHSGITAHPSPSPRLASHSIPCAAKAREEHLAAARARSSK